MEEQTNSEYVGNTPPTTSMTTVEEGKTIAIIAYITIFGLIAAFIMNNDKKNSFAAYHIRQSLGLGLTGLALGVVSWIPIIGWILAPLGTLFVLVLWIMGLVSALNGQEKPVPVLGDNYQEWLKGI